MTEPKNEPLSPQAEAEARLKQLDAKDQAVVRENLNATSTVVMAIATVVMAIATVAIFVAGLLQWNTLNGQLNTMQGQLDAMERDQSPYVFVSDPSSPSFHLPFADQKKGQVLWTWEFANLGRGIAYDLVISHFIKLGEAKPEHSYLTRPVAVGELPTGIKRVILTASGPVIEQSEYDKLFSTFLGIKVLILFSYKDAVGKSYDTTVCMGHSDSGRTAFIDPATCRS